MNFLMMKEVYFGMKIIVIIIRLKNMVQKRWKYFRISTKKINFLKMNTLVNIIFKNIL